MSVYCGPALQLTAGGTIYPGSVVRISTAADFQVLASVLASSPNIGLAQMGTRRAPGTADDDGSAAHANENIAVFGVGCIAAAMVADNTTVTRGDILTASTRTWAFSNGAYTQNGGVATTTNTGDRCIGFALQSGAGSDEIAVYVTVFVL